jgi:hypothetical protein
VPVVFNAPRWRISRSKTSGLVRMRVMNKWRVVYRVPLRVVVVGKTDAASQAAVCQALTKLIRSVAAAGFSSKEARVQSGEKQLEQSKPHAPGLSLQGQH